MPLRELLASMNGVHNCHSAAWKNMLLLNEQDKVKGPKQRETHAVSTNTRLLDCNCRRRVTSFKFEAASKA